LTGACGRKTCSVKNRKHVSVKKFLFLFVLCELEHGNRGRHARRRTATENRIARSHHALRESAAVAGRETEVGDEKERCGFSRLPRTPEWFFEN